MAGKQSLMATPRSIRSLTVSAAPPVDYYTVLELNSKASTQQIRDAYKKAALRYHPDRVPANSPDRASRTKKFQQVNDAYYTLVSG